MVITKVKVYGTEHRFIFEEGSEEDRLILVNWCMSRWGPISPDTWEIETSMNRYVIWLFVYDVDIDLTEFKMRWY